MVIGHNATLAWGLTNLGADVTDFFLERVDEDGTTRRDGVASPITERVEVIHVNGGDDVRLTVRESVHGPLVSDVLDLVGVGSAPVPEGAPGRRFEVALGWTALQPGRTMDAVLAMNVAEDAADIQAAAALFDVPSQNIVFATTDGHIGYQAPGRIPVRADVPGGPVPSDGTWPRPGWDSRYEWQGFVDPAAMPRALDPVEGVIVTANQAVTPAGVGPFLTEDWDYGYRAQRIRELLADATSDGKVGVADMARIQLDQHSPYADVLVPVLLSLDIEDAFPDIEVEFYDDGQELLRTWDRVQSEDSAAAAYFAAVWKEILASAFADDLPDGYGPSGGSRWLEVVRRLMAEPASPWWDDKSTPGVVEGRDEVLTRAMVTARRELTAQLGREATDWRWGQLHPAAPEHPVLGGTSLPGPHPRPGQPRAGAGRRGVLDRGRHRLGRELGLVRRHRGTVDADGRRPGRPRRVDVGDAHGRVRPPGERALRRPARPVVTGRDVPVAVHAGRDGGGRSRPADLHAVMWCHSSGVATASTRRSWRSRGSGRLCAS